MRFAFLISFLMASCNSSAADSYVLGRGISQKYISDIESPCVRQEHFVCSDVWFRWEIRVDETLGGPPIHGRIKAVLVQHSAFIPSEFKKFRLFVLSPIDDPKGRKLFQADYLLLELSETHEMYCLGNKPFGFVEDRGLYFGDEKGGRPYCFERPDENK